MNEAELVVLNALEAVKPISADQFRTWELMVGTVADWLIRISALCLLFPLTIVVAHDWLGVSKPQLGSTTAGLALVATFTSMFAGIASILLRSVALVGTLSSSRNARERRLTLAHDARLARDLCRFPDGARNSVFVWIEHEIDRREKRLGILGKVEIFGVIAGAWLLHEYVAARFPQPMPVALVCGFLAISMAGWVELGGVAQLRYRKSLLKLAESLSPAGK